MNTAPVMHAGHPPNRILWVDGIAGSISADLKTACGGKAVGIVGQRDA
ncbi:MAG: hypothetical protein AAF529_07575 [Pseudomonadota bacterium]